CARTGCHGTSASSRCRNTGSRPATFGFTGVSAVTAPRYAYDPQAVNPTTDGPMRGIRIIDCSIALTGPYALALLADQGADVVKVERPGFGDIARYVGVSVNGTSALYTVCNRGKRSIAIDLQQGEGRDLVLRLARDADVFVENYRPGVLERLGLGYDALSA